MIREIGKLSWWLKKKQSVFNIGYQYLSEVCQAQGSVTEVSQMSLSHLTDRPSGREPPLSKVTHRPSCSLGVVEL